ncbi:MAG: hypothetical protein JXB05_15475 [Myxococcaceae bacterium]|nr:hypothetical protein [Myxococcaceae bacterium]
MSDPAPTSGEALTPSAAPETTRGQWWAGLGLLLLATLLFRLPPLLNARGVHSDAAIVGLQARHMLQGEWSWYLWGAGYQGSLDALLLALAFKAAGATALVLMLVPLAGHVLVELLTFDILRRRLGPWLGLLATLPVVFTPQAISGVALYAPRQWCITLIFLGLWLLDGASQSRRPLPRYAAGAFMGPLAIYLDLYGLQLMPGFGAFALACCVDGWPGLSRGWRRLASSAAGGALGWAGLQWLRHHSGATASTASLSLEPMARNWNLLWEACLPWVLGYGVYVPGPNLYPDRWAPALPFALVQKLGAALLVLGIVVGGVSLFLWRLPWRVRRLGGLGAMVSAAALGGFLVSPMPADMWSARYLAPIVWFAPFALAPAALLLRARRFSLALAPYLLSAAVGGWMSYGFYVRGPLPRLDPRGVAREEMEVARVLRERGVTAAAAQYWLSYRLTFLFEENPVVIPLTPGDDRYPPYRVAFDQAPRVALIFHPSEPRAQPAPYEAMLRQQGARYERLEVAGFTVLLLTR